MNNSGRIHFRAEFIISKGKLEEYKKLVQELCQAVEHNEPDTIEYRVYFNDDETKCTVFETYTSSDAALFHNEGVASKTIIPKIMNISQINKFEVYGNPSDKLQKVLSSFNAQKFTVFAGFSR